ncbi:hypothetical protein FRA_24c00680 [Francisella sp. W12-1067]|nr:hypothetical protein FRA_24c00680 [Francisella sp. W12-1067]
MIDKKITDIFKKIMSEFYVSRTCDRDIRDEYTHLYSKRETPYLHDRQIFGVEGKDSVLTNNFYFHNDEYAAKVFEWERDDIGKAYESLKKAGYSNCRLQALFLSLNLRKHYEHVFVTDSRDPVHSFVVVKQKVGWVLLDPWIGFISKLPNVLDNISPDIIADSTEIIFSDKFLSRENGIRQISQEGKQIIYFVKELCIENPLFRDDLKTVFKDIKEEMFINEIDNITLLATKITFAHFDVEKKGFEHTSPVDQLTKNKRSYDFLFYKKICIRNRLAYALLNYIKEREQKGNYTSLFNTGFSKDDKIRAAKKLLCMLFNSNKFLSEGESPPFILSPQEKAALLQGDLGKKVKSIVLNSEMDAISLLEIIFYDRSLDELMKQKFQQDINR